MKICFYYYDINEIGGIESWLYYIGELYGKGRNIIVYYTTADERQLERLRKYVRVQKYYNQIVECDVAIFCRDMGSIIDNFKAKEKIQFVHGIFTEVGYKKLYTHPGIDRYIAVSKIAAVEFEKLTGKKCEVLYNPIKIDKPKKVLRLISATRISEDKGSIWSRMKMLANELMKNDIPFVWLVFTNGVIDTSIPGIVKMKPQLNITDYIANSDYLVQLSKSESYSYTAVESLSLGVPVIINNFSVRDEIGIVDGYNSYVLNMEMNNIDVNKIYNEIPRNFKYEIPEFDSGYKKLLGPTSKRFEGISYVKVRCCICDGFYDYEFDKHRKFKEVWETTRERALYLENFTNDKLIDIID